MRVSTSSFWQGFHGGCYEFFGNDRIKSIRDLKGKKVAIDKLGATDHAYIASMMAYVGMDPRTDVQWVETATGMFNEPMQGFLDGKVDAFLGFPPQPQHVRAKQIGHVLVNTAQDKPWSQYVCCMAVGQREFVRKNPVATKRALRALLKATDICALEPERACTVRGEERL
jgi:NitT/TauT family transport system substrate-binding protein